MSEKQAKKLFDSMNHLNDELIEDAQITPALRKRPSWRRWCSAAACLCLAAGIVFAALRGTGNPVLRAEDIWRGSMMLGGSDTSSTMDYTLRRFDTGEAILTSPVRDERDVEALSVYRSMEPKNSNDNYRLLLDWAEDLTQRAKEELNIELASGQVFLYQDPYDSSNPETNEFSAYSLEMELTYQDAALTLRCASDGSLTYYWLSDMEQLYAAACGPFSLPGDATDQQLLSAAEEIAAFVSALTGRNYTTAGTQVYRYENQPEKVSLHLRRTGLPGTQLSREMMADYGDLSIGMEIVDSQYRIRNLSILEEHYEYIGDYELISLAEAEEYVRKGYTFGGIYCPLCRAQSDLPALDFTDYDYVQVEYYCLGYAVPHYAFYKHIGQTERDGETYEQYGVVYVPAVKVSGMEQYLNQRAKEHKLILHTAEN